MQGERWLSSHPSCRAAEMKKLQESDGKQISCCHPEQKVTTRLVQGLQHRTWVLPLPAARVLCCSQWSCLPASPLVCLSTCSCWINPPKTEDQV